jgi:hypothetical protein
MHSRNFGSESRSLTGRANPRPVIGADVAQSKADE